MEGNFGRKFATYYQRFLNTMLFHWLKCLFRTLNAVIETIKEKYIMTYEHQELTVGSDEAKYDKLVDKKNYVPDVPEDIYGSML